MGLLDNLCTHPEHGPVDGDGQAVCVKCGAVLQVRLTLALMEKTHAQMWNQWHGHRNACVETPDGWCCVAGCPSAPKPF